MKSGIYYILNILNNKIYVGSAINIIHRMNQHRKGLHQNKHYNERLQKAWNKYGEDNFKFGVLEKVNNEDLIEREQYFIDYYKSSEKEYGYNICPVAGSSFGRKTSEEHKLKLSNAGKGRIVSLETRKKISESHKGKKFSSEHKMNISEAKKGNTIWLGRKHTEETKKKISESRKGKKLSILSRWKMSLARMGNKNSLGCKRTEEEKAKLSKIMKGNNYALGHKHTNKTKAKLSEINKERYRLMTNEQKDKQLSNLVKYQYRSTPLN